jgi:FlaA1/EpsC-like NDP-sugar epimerase
MLLDGLIVLISLILMSYVRLAMNQLPFITYLPAGVRYPSYIYAIFPVIWVAVLAAFSVYDGKKNFKIVDELSSLSVASLVASISQAGVLFLSYRDFSRALFLLVIAFSFLICLLWRLVVRLVFRFRKETLNFSRKLLVVGTGSELLAVENTIHENLSDTITDVSVLDLQNLGDYSTETPRLCPHTIEYVRSSVQTQHITDVVIAFPRSASSWIEAISSHLENLSLGVWVALDFHD